MTLTLSEIEDIRADLFAEDMAIPVGATSWSRDRVVAYFESAGESETAAASAAAAPTGGASSTMPAPAWTESRQADGTVVLAAPMTYKVVYSAVRVRKAPETTAAELGMLRMGTLIQVDAIKGDWVRIESLDSSVVIESSEPTKTTGVGSLDLEKHGGGWMLTDGKAMKLPILLKPHVVEVRAPHAPCLLA